MPFNSYHYDSRFNVQSPEPVMFRPTQRSTRGMSPVPDQTTSRFVEDGQFHGMPPCYPVTPPRDRVSAFDDGSLVTEDLDLEEANVGLGSNNHNYNSTHATGDNDQTGNRSRQADERAHSFRVGSNPVRGQRDACCGTTKNRVLAIAIAMLVFALVLATVLAGVLGAKA